MHTSTGTGCAFALVSSSRCLAKSEFMIDLEFDGVRVFDCVFDWFNQLSLRMILSLYILQHPGKEFSRM